MTTEATTQNVQHTYQATQISTATKEQLLLITYDIGIRSCRLAETALEAEPKDLDQANREILRTEEVIRELMVTLNTERGGEMAKGLMLLYDYMHQQLIEANVKKDAKNVATVRTMLEELKNTWEEALLKLLQEYQEAHPEDEDVQVALSVEAAAAKPGPVVQTPPDKPKPGGLNLAG